MKYLKLMKLLYLADRESMKRHGHPISGDRYVSMDHGPVLSNTLNLINGAVKFQERGWDHWIADKADYAVSLRRRATREVLDELSNADIDVLRDVFAKFGKVNQWDLVKYIHRYCREWQDPNGSSIPISYEEIFKALGRSPAEARKLGARVEQQRHIDKLFASL
ncbi:MAG TPA: Panacea domain-containing protein [Burkholderiales bacterium]|nr:Panacea domain-containing protein [Burkholderiales bacterium]